MVDATIALLFWLELVLQEDEQNCGMYANLAVLNDEFPYFYALITDKSPIKGWIRNFRQIRQR